MKKKTIKPKAEGFNIESLLTCMRMTEIGYDSFEGRVYKFFKGKDRLILNENFITIIETPWPLYKKKQKTTTLPAPKTLEEAKTILIETLFPNQIIIDHIIASYEMGLYKDKDFIKNVGKY